MDKYIRVVHGIHKNGLKKESLEGLTVCDLVLNSAVGPNFMRLFLDKPVKHWIVVLL
jgi:hypothetical protein